MDESVVAISFYCVSQDTDAEVACLTEKLHISNELLKASQKECSELSKKYSKLMFELAQCKSSLKNTEKLKEVTLYNSSSLYGMTDDCGPRPPIFQVLESCLETCSRIP
jgi:hypothetical protein